MNRLRIEEDSRIAGASSLIHDGVRGFELATRVLPREVELHLRSDFLGLEGSVDAVGNSSGRPFPIEYKTGRNPNLEARESHKLQVTAYCMLLDEALDVTCLYGELYYTRYFSRAFVPMSPASKRRVLALRERFLDLCTEGETSPVVVREVRE